MHIIKHEQNPVERQLLGLFEIIKQLELLSNSVALFPLHKTLWHYINKPPTLLASRIIENTFLL